MKDEIEQTIKNCSSYKAGVPNSYQIDEAMLTDQLLSLYKKWAANELKKLEPPEQFKDFAKLSGRDDCLICGFNSEKFRKHLDERIKALEGEK